MHGSLRYAWHISPIGFHANFSDFNHNLGSKLLPQKPGTLNIRCVCFTSNHSNMKQQKFHFRPRCFLWTSWTLLQQVHDMALLTLSSCLVQKGYKVESSSQKRWTALKLCWLSNAIFDFEKQNLATSNGHLPLIRYKLPHPPPSCSWTSASNRGFLPMSEVKMKSMNLNSWNWTRGTLAVGNGILLIQKSNNQYVKFKNSDRSSKPGKRGPNKSS